MVLLIDPRLQWIWFKIHSIFKLITQTIRTTRNIIDNNLKIFDESSYSVISSSTIKTAFMYIFFVFIINIFLIGITSYHQSNLDKNLLVNSYSQYQNKYALNSIIDSNSIQIILNQIENEVTFQYKLQTDYKQRELKENASTNQKSLNPFQFSLARSPPSQRDDVSETNLLNANTDRNQDIQSNAPDKISETSLIQDSYQNAIDRLVLDAQIDFLSPLFDRSYIIASKLESSFINRKLSCFSGGELVYGKYFILLRIINWFISPYIIFGFFDFIISLTLLLLSFQGIQFKKWYYNFFLFHLMHILCSSLKFGLGFFYVRAFRFGYTFFYWPRILFSCTSGIYLPIIGISIIGLLSKSLKRNSESVTPTSLTSPTSLDFPTKFTLNSTFISRITYKLHSIIQAFFFFIIISLARFMNSEEEYWISITFSCVLSLLLNITPQIDPPSDSNLLFKHFIYGLQNLFQNDSESKQYLDKTNDIKSISTIEDNPFISSKLTQSAKISNTPTTPTITSTIPIPIADSALNQNFVKRASNNRSSQHEIHV